MVSEIRPKSSISKPGLTACTRISSIASQDRKSHNVGNSSIALVFLDPNQSPECHVESPLTVTVPNSLNVKERPTNATKQGGEWRKTRTGRV